MNEPYYNPNSSAPMPPVFKKPTIPFASKDYLFAFLFLIGCIASVDFGLFGGFNAGYTISFILLCGIYFLYDRPTKRTVYSAVCIVLAMAASVVFALYDDGLIKFVLLCLSILLLAVAICERHQIHAYPAGSFRTISDLVYVLFVYPFVRIGVMMRSLFAKKNQKGAGSSIVLGLLCAVPIILIVVPLLMRADAAFAKLFDFITFENIIRLIFAVIFGCVFFIFLYSHAFGFRHALNHREPKTVTQKVSLPGAMLTTFLAAIAFFYVLYIGTQIAYFCSAFIGKMPEEFLPASYARRGFFEMCIICVINLGFLLPVMLVSKRGENGKPPKTVTAISAFISLFSMFLIVTAIAKMVLYIRSFGLTRLRLVTSAFMVFLFCVFAALLIRYFVRRLPYMKIVVLAAAVIACTVGFVDLDSTIAEYNVRAYQNGTLKSIDVNQLGNLNRGAIPYMLELLDDKNPNVRADVIEQIHWRIYEEDEGFDIRSFNYTTAKANKLIKEKKQLIEDLYNKQNHYTEKLEEK